MLRQLNGTRIKPFLTLLIDPDFTVFRHAEVGDHKEAGFADSAYAMSKVGIWKATAILADQIKLDPRHILMNSVGHFFSNIQLINTC